jgi:hypothetical protein
MRAVDPSCVNENGPPTNHSQKTVVTVFFGVEEIALLDIFPTGAELTSDYFSCNIIEVLEQVIYPGERELWAHFALLSISIMHSSMARKELNENLMSVSSADLNIRPIPRASLHVISFSSAIHMIRCKACHTALCASFKRRSEHN